MSTATATWLQSTPLHVGFAFVAMGAWAIFSNAAHPMPDPLIAGLVQGSISASLTLFLKRSVDWMRPRFGPAAGHVVPALIASLASAALLISAHAAAGTPEIALTIAVPLAVSASYIFSYNVMTQRKALRESDD